MKKIATMLLALVLTFSLSGCALLGGSDFDAELYILGGLKTLYLGEYDSNYLKILKSKKAELEESYENGIEFEYENAFSSYLDIYPDDLSDELNETGMALLRNIYSQSKFTVDSSKRLEDKSYEVTVTITPINILDDWIEKYSDDSVAKYLEQIADGLDETAGEVYWAELVFANLQELVDAGVSYGEPETITVRVYEDTDGLYTCSDSDLQAMDLLILHYEGAE